VFTPRPGTNDTLWQVLEGLSMQQYLSGIAEVPSSWPEAALESQAIAARTFAVSNIEARRADPNRTVPWDLFSSVYDQYYSGYGHEIAAMSDRWIAAVERTADRVLTYNGRPFAAFYSSSNGGYSEDSGYVFVTSLPYLVAQPDPFDREGNPFATWVREYSGSDVGRWIAAAGRGNIGDAVSVSISGNVGASGRVERATITVRGSAGTATMTGSQFRSAINNGVIAAGGGLDSQLLSTKFTVGRVAVAANLSAPFGELESVLRRNRTAIVGGWVADPDVVAAGANAAVAPVTVRITIGKRTVATTLATQYRFDMDQVHGHRTTRGFRVAVAIAERPRRVCAYATAQDGGPEVLLGCQRV
jgi:SpoIID/LytB domain protein